MPQDYARKNRASSPSPRGGQPKMPAQKTSRRKAPTPPRTTAPARRQSGGLSVKWIASLAAVGGFIGFIVYLNSLPVSETPTNQAGSQEQEKPAAKAPEEPEGFRFYDILPDSEVVAPEVNEYAPGPMDQEAAYLVQTGSFRSGKDAERQRAEIAFQGLRAKVDKVGLDTGSTWHRVNVGPFTNRSEMNAAIDKLVSINIQPLVRRVPRDKDQ
ncbi:MAG: SPOR domain-containing protein [Oleiphilaceae bacterium]|nr:SPOR domain-containing protein [Oleiphilaceae bacterium]